MDSSQQGHKGPRDGFPGLILRGLCGLAVQFFVLPFVLRELPKTFAALPLSVLLLLLRFDAAEVEPGRRSQNQTGYDQANYPQR